MNFILNDNAVDFELEDNKRFEITDGPVNFNLSSAVDIIPPPTPSQNGLDYELDFSIE